MEQLEIIDTCEGCGACCLEQESPPLYLWILDRLEGRDNGDIAFHEKHNPGDLARVRVLPEELKQELRDYSEHLKVKKLGHPNNDICIWFDEEIRKCKHHDLRPDTCREFEVGDEGCLSWREEYADNIV